MPKQPVPDKKTWFNLRTTGTELAQWKAHAWVYAKPLSDLIRDLLQADRERLVKKGVDVPEKLPERK